MKPADLKILVQEGEGTTLEFKENLPAVRAMAEGQVAGEHRAGARQVTGQVPRKYPPSTPQGVAVLLAARGGDTSREELQAAAGIKDRKHFRTAYLGELIAGGLIELTVPDKPRSSKQRYRLTPADREYLEKEKQ